MTVYPVILAAGASRRFGSPKQLQPWDGGTLLQHVLSQAQAVGNAGVTVVLGAHARAVRAVLPERGVCIVTNRQWREGMASSIRAGVGALPRNAGAVLFMLGDQPGVGAGALSALVDRCQRAPALIVAARYSGTDGVPAVFPRELFGALLELHGERGAKPLFTQYRDRLVSVPVPEAAVDIDTPDDLHHCPAEHQVTGV